MPAPDAATAEARTTDPSRLGPIVVERAAGMNLDTPEAREHLRALEVEVVRVRRERDDLSERLTALQQTSTGSVRRCEELEQQVQPRLTAAEAQIAELQTKLNAAQEAAAQAETAFKEEAAKKERLEERLQTLTNSLRREQAERGKRFEQEQITLRQERDQLDGKLAGEQKAAAESAQRAKDLESLLGRNAAEFARAKAEMERQATERQQAESSWREQLDTAFVMKKELEGAVAGAVEQNKKVEEELALLRKEHDELQDRLKAEQQAAADSRQRAKGVESSLGRNAAEFDRIKAELDKQTNDRETAEVEWREELVAAQARREKLEKAYAEALERSQRFESEIRTLRQERDSLKTELKLEKQQAADATRQVEELKRRMDRQSAELQPIKTTYEKQQGERERAEAKLREQLEAAKAQKKEIESAWSTAVERTVQFEEELASLRRERDEMSKRLSSERQRHDGESSQQLETARALAKKLETAWTTALERNKRVESELASLRRERDDLAAKLPPDQRPAARRARSSRPSRRSPGRRSR